MEFVKHLKFNSDGLIPAIVQDATNGRVLMMAWMNESALEKTVQTSKTHFWSRSRQKFWMKGESSGHTQAVKDVAFDCDSGTVVYSLKPGTAEASHKLLKRSSPSELAAFKAIQDDMACKPDGFVRSHGVSETRRWHSFSGDPWQSFTTRPQDCE